MNSSSLLFSNIEKKSTKPGIYNSAHTGHPDLNGFGAQWWCSLYPSAIMLSTAGRDPVEQTIIRARVSVQLANEVHLKLTQLLLVQSQLLTISI